MSEPADEGGSPVCFLPHVCLECGRLATEEEATTCPECGAELPVAY